jgi:hypothetical protein
VFLGGVVVAVIGFLLALRLREVPLRRRATTVAANVVEPGPEGAPESVAPTEPAAESETQQSRA